MKKILLTVFLLIISAQVNGQAREDYCFVDTTITFKVNSTIPELLVKIISKSVPDQDDSSFALQEFTYIITSKDKKDTIQIIYDGTDLGFLPCEFEDLFKETDPNFDGFKDFRYIYTSGATANPQYNFWIYNTKTKKFEQEESLSQLKYPEINYATKQIEEFDKCGGGCWTRAAYNFNEHKLTLVKYVSSEYAYEKGNAVYLKYKFAKLINGKLKIIRDKIFTEVEFEKQENIDWNAK